MVDERLLRGHGGRHGRTSHKVSRGWDRRFGRLTHRRRWLSANRADQKRRRRGPGRALSATRKPSPSAQATAQELQKQELSCSRLPELVPERLRCLRPPPGGSEVWSPGLTPIQARASGLSFLKTPSRGSLFLWVPEEPLSPGLYPGFQMLGRWGLSSLPVFFLHPKGTLTKNEGPPTPLSTCLW